MKTMPARKRVPLISPFGFALCMFIMPICSLLLAAQPDSLIGDDDDPGDPTPSVVEPTPASTGRPSPSSDDIPPVRSIDEIAPMGATAVGQPDGPLPDGRGPMGGVGPEYSNSSADSPSGRDCVGLKPGCRFRYVYKCDSGTFHLTEKGGTAHYIMPDGRRNLVMLDRPCLNHPCRACRDNPAKEFDLPPCCENFLYFVPDPGCDDTSICAWAFSRQPCGCKGYAVMKCVFTIGSIPSKWHFHCWARRDTMCDNCFPPNPPNCPTCPPPCNSCHHHPCLCCPHCHHHPCGCHHCPPQIPCRPPCWNPCWSNCCWPIWHCNPCYRGFSSLPCGTSCGSGPYLYGGY